MPYTHRMENGVSIPLSEEEISELERVETEIRAQQALEAPLEEVYRKRTARKADGGYGTPGEQLEILGEEGQTALREHILAVKARFPKPE